MGKRNTIAQFIERAKDKHNDKYDYSKVVYINNKTKIIITCPIHGDFEQRPDKHLKGESCPSCGGSKKITFDEFKDKSKEVHNNKYDYSKVVYTHSKEKVIITCPIHGDFEQRPHNHLRGEGCRSCSYLIKKNCKKLTNDDFILRGKEKHGDKYDYSKSVYLSIKDKVIITCPEHGDFEQRANNHLRGDACPKCKGGVSQSFEEFVNKAKEKHEGKYDYSKTVYINNISKLIITCPEHGDFEQRAQNHLRGDACPKCSNNKVLSTEDIIERATKTHGDKYDYSKVVAGKNNNAKITIICKKHGDFKQAVFTHLAGAGCRKCKESRGESKVRVFLEQNNIEYSPQHKFNDCKDIRPLPFDFYLPQYNLCVEYNGEQHYRPFNRFGGEKTFISQKKRDKIKKEYCEQKDIPLLIIKHNENVKKILNKIIINI